MFTRYAWKKKKKKKIVRSSMCARLYKMLFVLPFIVTISVAIISFLQPSAYWIIGSLFSIATTVAFHYFCSWLRGRSRTGVARSLVGLVSSDKDGLATVQVIDKKKAFTVFNEKTYCKFAKGIPIDQLDKVNRRISLLSPLADKVDLQSDVETVSDLSFTKGEKGEYLYGRIAKARSGRNKIDLACYFYNLEFRLAPNVTITTTTWSFFWGLIKIPRITRETEEQDLSLPEMYFRKQAIDKFISTTESPELMIAD